MRLIQALGDLCFFVPSAPYDGSSLKMPAATLKTRDVDYARFISKGEVLARVGVSFPTVWLWMREGKFPRSRAVGGKSVWLEHEIEQWILSRPVRRLKGDA
jgi:predicted DNA-binding transcriptional regulator AlpA